MHRDSISTVSSSHSVSSISKVQVSAKANRPTKLKILTGIDENGKEVGMAMQHPQINFMIKDLTNFYKSVHNFTRLKPADPMCEIDYIKIKKSDGKYSRLDMDNFSNLMEDALQQHQDTAISLKVYVTVVEDSRRSDSRPRARQSSANSENLVTNSRPPSPSRTAYGTAPKRDVCHGITNVSKSNPLATPSSPSVRRSVSTGRSVDRGPLTPKPALPVFNTKPGTPLRTGSPMVNRRTPRGQGSVGGIATPQSAVRARSAIRINPRTISTATSTTSSIPGGGRMDHNLKRKKDRSSPKTSPVKNKRDSTQTESESVLTEQLETELTKLTVGTSSPSDLTCPQDTLKDDNVAVTTEDPGKCEEGGQSLPASRNPSSECISESVVEESSHSEVEGAGHCRAADVDMSPSLTYDLSEGEEEPDMGHGVWRESIVCKSNRKQQVDRIEKCLDFAGCSADGDDGNDVDGPAGGMECDDNDHYNKDEGVDGDDDWPEEESEECTAGERDTINALAEQPTNDTIDRSIPDFMRPTATSAVKSKQRPPVKKQLKLSKSTSQIHTLQRAKTTPQKPSASPGMSIASPDGSVHMADAAQGTSSKLMQPTASFSAGSEDTSLKSGVKKWEESLRGPDPAPKRDKTKMSARERAKAYKPEASMLRAMREDTKSCVLPDGRPSMNTMSAQWEFMRDQFLGTNENLEWAMTAKQGGEQAYRHAHRKAQMAEDQYYRAIFEIDIVESKIASVRGYQIEELLEEMGNQDAVLSKNPYDTEAGAIVEKNRTAIEESFSNGMKGLFSANLEKGLKDICGYTDLSRASKKAKVVLSHLIPLEKKAMKDRLQAAHVASNESLAEMEKWSTREKETSQYAIVLAEEDATWLLDNCDKNMEALETMRSLIPTRVAEMSLKDIEEFVKANNGLYTPELIAEIKTNKLLHWVVTHTEDIAFANFLSGEHRQYFVNVEGLDVTELRALRVVLPDKFELDSDGAKAEWRERFISRVKQLVSQENGDMIKGGWDSEMGKRAMVCLPALKRDQVRRGVYFYRTKAELEKRLKQYDDKDLLLEKKEALLAKAIEEATEMRLEYDTVLEETRDPVMKAAYGADKLAVAKDCAKRDWQTADRRKNDINLEVSRLKKAISSNPISREQFVSFMADQEGFLASQNWAESEEPIVIDGVCDRFPDIKKIERSSAKFVSAEQEAQQRKQELTKISAGVGAPSGDDEDSSIAAICVSVGASEEVSVDSSGGEGELKANVDAPVSAYLSAVSASSTSEPVVAPVAVGRRNSVLQKANPDMLNVLNAMLSSTSASPARAPISTRRASVAAVSTPVKASAAIAGEEGGIPAEAKPIRSRNLKRILEIGENAGASRASMTDARPQLSFLDQLKVSQKRHASAGDVSCTINAAPPSFLDAIKARRRAAAEE